jgi:flotillin
LINGMVGQGLTVFNSLQKALSSSGESPDNGHRDD